MVNRRALTLLLGGLTLALVVPGAAAAQLPSIQYGDAVPADVKMIYERGLVYLADTQQEDGSWAGGQAGAGVTGMCLMVFLAHGEDPNFGKYRRNIQLAIQSIINGQDERSGYLQNSMYHHGFGMLALAEAYGAVDETQFAAGDVRRSIGKALELAVRCAVTGQNSEGGWRYTPGSGADTSVSGAVLMGLLAARNAGIEVPDNTVEKALKYFQGMTSGDGTVNYSGRSGHGASMNRSSIATLVYSISKRKDWTQYDATSNYIAGNLEHQEGGYPFYFRYYMAQALFQSDYEAWTRWKRLNTDMLRDQQREDGHFDSSHGPAYGTAMSLLSLALEYRYLPIYER
jgi:hypothetical protein